MSFSEKDNCYFKHIDNKYNCSWDAIVSTKLKSRLDSTLTPHIVKYYDKTILGKNARCCDIIDGITFQNLIMKDHDVLRFVDRLQFLFNLLEIFHNEGITFYDIHPENIMVHSHVDRKTREISFDPVFIDYEFVHLNDPSLHYTLASWKLYDLGYTIDRQDHIMDEMRLLFSFCHSFLSRWEYSTTLKRNVIRLREFLNGRDDRDSDFTINEIGVPVPKNSLLLICERYHDKELNDEHYELIDWLMAGVSIPLQDDGKEIRLEHYSYVYGMFFSKNTSVRESMNKDLIVERFRQSLVRYFKRRGDEIQSQPFRKRWESVSVRENLKELLLSEHFNLK